jgi:TRAP-type C4-dicarboxylate transport system permease small subunit
MRTYIRIMDALSRLGGLIAMALLAAAVVVVCQMIIVRYFLNSSTVWQTEFVVYSLMAATFIGSPYVLLHKAHVGVDLIPNASGPRLRYWLELTAALLSLAFCGLVAWSGWLYLHEAWSGGWTTQTVWALPLWIPLLPLPVGFGLLCLQYVAELAKIQWPELAPGTASGGGIEVGD